MNKKTYLFLLFVVVIGAALLRLVRLGSIPASPYWEEVALGYDAYSVLETGKDHHGNAWPTVAFESFGDWKPSGYFYALLPFVSIGGLSVFTVRLPAALSGVVLVLIISQLVIVASKIFRNESANQSKYYSLSLLTAAVTAISPWSLLISRGAWEVSLATTLVTCAGWQALLAISSPLTSRSGKKLSILHWSLAAVAMVAAMYTYHAARITAPLLVFGVGMLWLMTGSESDKTPSFSEFSRRIVQKLQLLVVPVALTVLLCLPFLFALGSDALGKRFQETSIFSDIAIIQHSNQMRELAGNTIVSKILYHRYVLFGTEIVRRFSQHLSIGYLFVGGDENARHSVPFFGQLYHFELIFVLFGIGAGLKKWNSKALVMLWWLIAAVLPASVTLATPHALRSFAAAPVLYILIALGIVAFGEWLHRVLENVGYLSTVSIRRVLVGLLIVGIYLIELLWFSRVYFCMYPKIFAKEWQFGYEQMVEQVTLLERENPGLPVFISRHEGRPAMYYWFYTVTDPRLVQAEDAYGIQDQGEYLTFANKHFISGLHEITMSNAIVAVSAADAERLGNQLTATKTIVDPNGEIVWVIGMMVSKQPENM